MSDAKRLNVTPSASRLTESLRDIGYDFASAVADLIDNSITAGANQIEIVIQYDAADSYIMIADNGRGMSANGVLEALRFGSRRTYSRGDLGRYGLGLKTASLSQARCLTVLSRYNRNIATRQLSLDTIAYFDDWLIVAPRQSRRYIQAQRLLGDGTGTVIVWEQLDRIFQEQKPEGGWARRRIERLAERATEHLSVVFHRFLEGDGVPRIDILVNGQRVHPWNPFALEEPATVCLPVQTFELNFGDVSGQVRLERFVLPPRNSFTSTAEFERLSGPRKWNRQQGLYIYRANRLVQWGGWAGIRAIDEHLKLARAAIDFDTDLDSAFNINVAKMRVALPTGLKTILERPIHDLCLRADDAYRRAALGHKAATGSGGRSASRSDGATTLLALRAAAMAVGETESLGRILAQMSAATPGVAAGLGLSPPESAAV